MTRPVLLNLYPTYSFVLSAAGDGFGMVGVDACADCCTELLQLQGHVKCCER